MNKKTTDECYCTGCENFVRRDGTVFEFSGQAFGALGKCYIQRPIENLTKCGMYVERIKRYNTKLAVVRMALELEN